MWPFNRNAVCESCGMVFRRKNCKVVNCLNIDWSGGEHWTRQYFCTRDEPHYDKRVSNQARLGVKYYKWVQVAEYPDEALR